MQKPRMLTRLLAGRRLDRIKCGERTETHIVLEALLGVLFGRIDPRDYEDAVPAFQHVAHQAVLRPHVEDVVLVDPGRHEEKRALALGLGQRLVLDELHQVVLVDDLARGRRQVATDNERLLVVGGYVETAFTMLQIVQEVLEPVQDALSLGFDESVAGGRVQGQEVARRQRAQELPGVELHAQMVLRPLGQGVEKLVDRPFDGEMRIAQAAAYRVLLPGLVAKALVGHGGALAGPGIDPGFRRVEPDGLLERGQFHGMLRELGEGLHSRCAGRVGINDRKLLSRCLREGCRLRAQCQLLSALHQLPELGGLCRCRLL